VQTDVQLAPETETLLPETIVEPRWPLTKRICFRLAFGYLVLYIIPFPIEYLPFTDSLVQKYNNLLHIVVPWVAKHILHLSYDITIFENGSGDTTYNYVLVLCLFSLAVVAAVIWSVLDRKRADYTRLYRWLRLLVRFSLASAMIGYGAVKIIPLQMSAPSFSRLLEPYGDSSPMGLLWTFVGASKGFEIFTGCAEMLSGVLLIFPRTTMAGALISLANTTQIFILNMSYDVPVKLYSFHLFLMSFFLLAPDLKRLVHFFLFNRAVDSVEPSRLFRRRWLNRSAVTIQILFGLYLIGSSFYQGYQQSKVYGSRAEKPPLYGIWTVDEFSMDGKELPPLTTDASRWQRVIFQVPKFLTIQPMSGPNQVFVLDLSVENRTLSIAKRDNPDWKAEIAFEEIAPGQINLKGEVDGHTTAARLTRFDESKFLLTNRGFHWIQEYPFNR
jgi:hypothetical protein